MKHQSEEMDMTEHFGDVFEELVKQANQTADRLAASTNIPKQTLIAWLQGRVARPRKWHDIVKVATALRLYVEELNRLLQAARYPTVGELIETARATQNAQELDLLAPWAEGRNASPPRITTPSVPIRPPEVTGFVGREKELAYFSHRLATTHFAVISGMPGVGKTLLAARLARGFAPVEHIFWHAFHEGEGVNVIIWKLAGFLAWHGQDEVWQMLQNRHQTDSQPLPTEMIFEYLIGRLHEQSYLFCLDDFQFVDEDPLLEQFIGRLRDVSSAGALTFIITSRRMPQFVQVTSFDPLEGLTLADTQQLLTTRQLTLTPFQVTTLHTHTDGNAQFLTLAIAAIQQGGGQELLQRLASVTDIERFLMNEVDRNLTDAERDMMGAVAILLGYSGSREVIETIVESDHIFKALQSLSGRYLLIVHERTFGKEYSQHSMVQAFYYQMLSQRQRQEMHQRAGGYYELGEQDWFKAGLHYYHAGAFQQAAEQVTTKFWQIINQGQARALARLLEDITRQQVNLETKIQVNLALGQVYVLLGEVQKAHTSYQEALAQLDNLPDSPTKRKLKARACRDMGELLEQEAPQEALEWLQRGLNELAEEDEPEKAALYLKIGTVQLNRGNYPEALSALEQGLVSLPQTSRQLRCTALRDMGVICFCLDDIEGAMEHTIQALAISRELHDHFQTADLLSNLGPYKFTAGDWSGAIADLEQALVLADRLDSEIHRTSAEGNLGAVYIYTGDDDEKALGHLMNALNRAYENKLHLFEVANWLRLTQLRIAQDEWEATIAPLQEAKRIVLQIEAKGNEPEVYRAWAEIKLAMGEFQAALESAGQSVELARDLKMGIEEGKGLRVLGQALLKADQYESALATFEQSFSLLDGRDCYEAARTQEPWGLALVSGGEAEQGNVLLQKAQATYLELGAKRDLARLNQIINKMMT